MVTFHIAYTAPINPPSSSPTLSIPQIWTGLQRKVRHAQEFVPVMESCTVQKEEDGIVTRVVKLRDGPEATEVVTSFYPSWIEFKQPDGATIRNVISEGSGYGPEQLHMTYMFEVRRPDLEEGSEAAEKAYSHMKDVSRMAVEFTVKTIREMVQDGRISADGTWTA